MKEQILTEIFYIKLITNKNIIVPDSVFAVIPVNFHILSKSIYKIKLQYLSKYFYHPSCY